jgi:L-rhamnose isomerase/sugar isomerase
LASRPQISYSYSINSLLRWQVESAAFRTDVEPILAMARLEAGAAIDPISMFRTANYRAKVADKRPAVTGSGGGIV